MTGGQHIGTDHVGQRVVGQRDAIGRVGAVIVMHRAANAAQTTVGIAGDLHVPDLIAFERRSAVKFSIRSSIHLTGCCSMRATQRNHEFFGMEHRFRSEAAADIGRDHAQFAIRTAQRRDEDRLRAMRHLRAVPDGQQVFGRIEARQHAARSRSNRPSPCADGSACGNCYGGLREGAVDVAIGKHMPRDEIVRTIEPRARRAWRESCDRIGDRRQWRGIEFDQSRRRLRRWRGFRRRRRRSVRRHRSVRHAPAERTRHRSGSRPMAAQTECGRASDADAYRRR